MSINGENLSRDLQNFLIDINNQKKGDFDKRIITITDVIVGILKRDRSNLLDFLFENGIKNDEIKEKIEELEKDTLIEKNADFIEVTKGKNDKEIIKIFVSSNVAILLDETIETKYELIWYESTFEMFEIVFIKKEFPELTKFCRKFSISFNQLKEYEMNIFEDYLRILAAKREIIAFEGTTQLLTGDIEFDPDVKDEDKFEIPDDIKDCIVNLSKEISKQGKSDILMRDKEVENAIIILGKARKRNVIFVGPPGTGKTSIVEQITFLINTGKVPDYLKGCTVFSLNMNSLISNTKYRGSAEKKFDDIIKFVKKYEKVILFVDEAQTILGAGKSEGNQLDFANALKPILAEGKIRVICATTTLEYNKYFSKDPAFRRRFNKVMVEEPELDKVYSMIKARIENLSKVHDNVKISKAVSKYAIFIAQCFKMDTYNPDKAIDTIDRAMVNANIKNHKNVNKKDVLRVFVQDIKKFDKMDKDIKMRIAYHEMGHYIVNRFIKNEKYVQTIAVTIIPTDNYSGANVLSNINKANYISNVDDLKKKIASYLGGRYGEYLYKKDYSLGAQNDLKEANQIAEKMVCEYGLTNIKKYSQNRTFSQKDRYGNSSLNEEINKEICKIIDECGKNAKEIVEKNEKLLEALVNKILDKRILDKQQLDEIVEKYNE